jgi:sulfatase maturation enzyme AslB (radical SAM superfamily)
METSIKISHIPAPQTLLRENGPSATTTSLQAVSSFFKPFLWLAIKLRIFFFACTVLKKPSLIWRTYWEMLHMRNNVWGGDLKKLYRVDGKLYFNLYTPGWPSKGYDNLIKSELQRRASPHTERERLSFVHLAITRKCPLRCEHCFEWDNLNQKESFTKEDLLKVIELYQKEGALQMHFTGGEPMVRFKDLVELVAYASPKTACWVLTSGFNFTPHNAQR